MVGKFGIKSNRFGETSFVAGVAVISSVTVKSLFKRAFRDTFT
jgi:hypothetical protein